MCMLVVCCFLLSFFSFILGLYLVLFKVDYLFNPSFLLSFLIGNFIIELNYFRNNPQWNCNQIRTANRREWSSQFHFMEAQALKTKATACQMSSQTIDKIQGRLIKEEDLRCSKSTPYTIPLCTDWPPRARSPAVFRPKVKRGPPWGGSRTTWSEGLRKGPLMTQRELVVERYSTLELTSS